MNVIKNISGLIKVNLYALILTFLLSCSQQPNKTDYTIAYSSKESGDMEVYLTNYERKTKFRLTNRNGRDAYAAWSPDGKKVAMYAYHDEGNTWSIHTINIDGTDRKRLTDTKNKWDSSPTWSPDGKKIAFSREYSDLQGEWQEEIWLMNVDGSEQKQIKSINGGGPYFTQDGRILFHSKTNKSEICIADRDGSNLIKLTNNDAEDWHPEISPDGKQIAFISNRDGNLEIYIMDVDGSNQKRLTHNKEEDWDPSWSPDGKKIIFYTRTDKESHINIMNKDGSGIITFIQSGSSASWLKKSE